MDYLASEADTPLAVHSGAGCRYKRLAHNGRVCGLGNHLPDDPGPIAINAATFIGMKTSGVLGAIIATIGCVTPSCIIVLTLAYLYYKYRGLPAIQGVLKGLRPAVVSLIAFAGISIVQMALFGGKSESIFSIDISSFDVVSGVLFAAALVVMRRFKPNPIYVMAGAGFVGLLAFYII